MPKQLEDYDFTEAVDYHYECFPPNNISYESLVAPISAAAGALARYDAKLEKLHNKELLLAPLRNTEAVVSSRIEGTIATLDEILRIQADVDDDIEESSRYRQEAIEVFSYTRAVKHAQSLMENGLPICSRLIKETHSRLLLFGRGADKTPGQYKNDQNYVADKRSKKILFVPSSVNYLEKGIKRLEEYTNREDLEPLVQTAIMHLEFEALHPFKDGNGRLGRMLIPLNLWQRSVIHAPHLYVSPAVEERRDEYVERLREVSQNNDWTGWITFFLEVVRRQAEINTEITNDIEGLYDEMASRFRHTLNSPYSHEVLDFVFTRPVFRNSALTSHPEIPSQTAHRLSRKLVENEILTEVEQASGRRPAMLAFEPLLEIVRN